MSEHTNEYTANVPREGQAIKHNTASKIDKVFTFPNAH